MSDLRAAAAAQRHQRARRHGRRRADLGLTAAGRTRDARAEGDDRTDARRDIERLEQLVLRQLVILAQRQQHRRQHAAGPRRRRGDDPPHAGVRLRHGERLGDDLADIAARHGTAAEVILPHLHPVAADQTAHGALAPGIGVRRVLHGLPRREHLRHGRLTADLPLLHVVGEDNLPEGEVAPLHALKDLLH